MTPREKFVAAALAAAAIAPTVALAVDRGPGLFTRVDAVNRDPTMTTLGVRGVEAGLGTAKISHDPSAPGAQDANASVLSLRANGESTRTQGIYFDAPGSDVAKILNFRLRGQEVFTLVPHPSRPGAVQLRIKGDVVQVP